MRKSIFLLGVAAVIALQFWQVEITRKSAGRSVSYLKEDLQKSGMAQNQIHAIAYALERTINAEVSGLTNLQLPLWGAIAALGYVVWRQKERLDKLEKDE